MRHALGLACNRRETSINYHPENRPPNYPEEPFRGCLLLVFNDLKASKMHPCKEGRIAEDYVKTCKNHQGRRPAKAERREVKKLTVSVQGRRLCRNDPAKLFF